MIPRQIQTRLLADLSQFPVVALIGARQVGKTTLARSLLAGFPGARYLDLELPSDRSKLDHPEIYLRESSDRLVVLDEIQVVPDLFPVLRALVDEQRRPGRFLILGSASPGLIQRSAESLAGRIAYLELSPLRLTELPADISWRLHWWRGGFPGAILAKTDLAARRWLDAFVRTYVERDLAQLGLRLTPQVLVRLLAMISHGQGQQWNAQRLASSLGMSAPTVSRYRDMLEGTFLLRVLPPHHRNIGKRLVKTPKVYLRDSGLAHRLLRIPDSEALSGHPVLGSSFEGYALEQVCAVLPEDCQVSFWRSHGGAEIDLVIQRGEEVLACVDFKYGSQPRASRGFYEARRDLGDPPGYLIHPSSGSWPVAEGVRAVGLRAFVEGAPFGL